MINDDLCLLWRERLVRRGIAGSPEFIHYFTALFQHPGKGFHRTRVNPFTHVHSRKEGLGYTPFDFHFHKNVFEINKPETPGAGFRLLSFALVDNDHSRNR